ncbi:expressed unknown protein [Seminavis robusta]|uniref:Uncharacterized protein n=1 Tax=Seminavis robusta TaxID=568900 RepID=A0A9N8HPD0_9STRA|nr:expressed unknown protein [Seminavis robusta]|eukprot:Sro1315_g262050.1 n/a (239) ;mRNA; f:17091-17807
MTKATNESSKGVAKAAKKKTTAKVSSSKTSSGGGPQRILDLVLSIETRSGDPNVPRKMVASLSGLKATTFPVTISGMKKKQGLIDYDKDFIRLTEAGRAKANAAEIEEIAMDNDTAQAEIKEKHKLGNGMAGRLFDLLKDGGAHDRNAVKEQLGCQSNGSFAVMICNLKKKGIIVYDRVTIQLADICFPLGRGGNSDCASEMSAGGAKPHPSAVDSFAIVPETTSSGECNSSNSMVSV